MTNVSVKVVEKNTFYVQELFSPKIITLIRETVWKNTVESDRPQMTHVHCMLDTSGYKDTLRI
jgi:hypothetical protein